MAIRLLLLFCLCLSALLSPQSLAAQQLAIDPQTCLGCHSDSISPSAYASSVHGDNACTSCHIALTDLAAHLAGGLPPPAVDCSRCHQQIAAQHAGSVHQRQGLACVGCHRAIHQQKAWRGNKIIVVETCLHCHDDGDYRQSVHGKSVFLGNTDAPACHDCHQLHDILPLAIDREKPAGSELSGICISCHGDREMMTRHQVATAVVSSFVNSYHGKSYRLGFPEDAAGCADCHRAHLVLPQEDPASSLHADNLVQTCGRCHPDASPLFVQFYPHADYHDRDKYPLLYWTYVAMTALLVIVFSVFWFHSLLWLFRGFVETREKLAAQARGEGHFVPRAKQQYRRFGKQHIFFHLLVIISFLGLSLTGLPLKFSDQDWAQTMMSFFGGVKLAGLLHRGCAVLTFYYFIAALLMSFNFLFISKKFAGNWWQRLLGPDSLLPNRRDSEDAVKMARWFCFKGPKPTFERWTYWEKFDFLAVFWGMFAIGGSGLMLWFPEFFGAFLPGWMFNIATIVHSDEALLATGFIFTVHFFNTHLRPEKFPMDFVIFNGQISRDEFIEERGDQWRRYEQAGITEQFLVDKPSGIAYDFFFKGFGFLAVFVGLVLAFLMILAFIGG